MFTLPTFAPISVVGRRAIPRTLVAHGQTRPVMNIISRDEINQRIHDFSSHVLCNILKGTEATFVPVMNGGLFFCADVARNVAEGSLVEIMPVPAHSYGLGRASGPVSIAGDLIRPSMITGRTVIVLDDIFETGNTASEVIKLLKPHKPAQVITVFLTRKMIDKPPAINPDYWLFELYKSSWAFGYGMDLGQKYRHLRYICDDNLALYNRDGSTKY